MTANYSRRTFLLLSSHMLLAPLVSPTVAKADKITRAPIVFTHYMHCYVSGAINSEDAAVKYYKSRPGSASAPPLNVESQWFLSDIIADDIGGQKATDADFALMGSIGINAAGLLISPTHLPSSAFARALHMAARSAEKSSVKIIPELWFDATTTDPDVYGREIANFLHVHPNSGLSLGGKQIVLLSYLAKDASTSFNESSARDYLDRLFNHFGGRERVFLISNLPFGSDDIDVAPFAKFSDALGAWTPQDDWLDRSASKISEVVTAAGKDFVQPIAQAFYQRRRGKPPWEYGNSFGSIRLTDAWRRAIKNRPKFIEIETWNDFSEDTDLRPSNVHGFAYMYIVKYFIDLLKNGHIEIEKEHMIIFHPRQSVEAKLDDAKATCKNHSWRHIAPMCDYICIVTMLNEPAKIRVRIGAAVLESNVTSGFNESLFINKRAAQNISGEEVESINASYPINGPGRNVQFVDENFGNISEVSLLMAGRVITNTDENVSLTSKSAYCDLTVVAQCVDVH
jgi:hypothetical protein